MPTTHRFSIHAQLRYRLAQDGWLLLNIAPVERPSQKVVHENIRNNRGIPFRDLSAPKGTTRLHGIAVPAGNLEITYEAEVERQIFKPARLDLLTESLLIDLPAAVVPYLYPSRYCESDKLVRLATKQFGDLRPGHERVAGICDWIHSRIDYAPGTTDAHTSAVDCLTLRAGVCRDFAHLGVAFCRAMGIPARYGSAYAYRLLQPDFHAFFEVWLGDRWWYYDATRLAPQQGFIRVGCGHDAADTSVATMSSLVYFESMDIHVKKLTSLPIEYSTCPVGF